MSEVVKHFERTILFQNDHFEIISIFWNESGGSPVHDHGGSQCFVLIQDGVFENTMDLGVKTEIRRLEPGQVLSTPVGAKHSMLCKSKTGKTLHVYCPKIKSEEKRDVFKIQGMDQFSAAIGLKENVRIDELEKLLAELKSHSVSTDSPYFMNQLFSGILPQMLMGEQFIAQTKSTMATLEASPILSEMESEVIRSLSELVGWKGNAMNGISVPGGSAANFMAIHCARQKLMPQIKTKGMTGQCLKVFASEEAHYSLQKACMVLGIGTDNLISIPVDQKGQMNVEILLAQIQNCKREGDIPLAVVATAGTTVLGAFDSIQKIAQVCQSNDVWLHVDAAWGGPVLFSKKWRSLMDGVELADSLTFDAHKLLGAGLTSSFFLSQHEDILLKANDVTGGEYLFHASDKGVDRGKMSWQCGRKAEAASFWTLWKNVGTQGFGAFVDRMMELREQTVRWVQTQPRLQLIAQPNYLNICVRVLPPSLNKDPDWSCKVRESLKDKNLALVNYSKNNEGSFLRLILAHPNLQMLHLQQILEWSMEVT